MLIKSSKIPILCSKSSRHFKNEYTPSGISPPPSKKHKLKSGNSSDASTECDLRIVQCKSISKVCGANCNTNYVISRIPVLKSGSNYASSKISITFSQHVTCPTLSRQYPHFEINFEPTEVTQSAPSIIAETHKYDVGADNKIKPKKSEVKFFNKNVEPSSPRQSFEQVETKNPAPTKEKSLTKRLTLSSIGFLVKKLKRSKLPSKEILKYRKRKLRFPRISEGEIPPFLFCGSVEKKIYHVSKYFDQFELFRLVFL